MARTHPHRTFTRTNPRTHLHACASVRTRHACERNTRTHARTHACIPKAHTAVTGTPAAATLRQSHALSHARPHGRFTCVASFVVAACKARARSRCGIRAEDGVKSFAARLHWCGPCRRAFVPFTPHCHARAGLILAHCWLRLRPWADDLRTLRCVRAGLRWRDRCASHWMQLARTRRCAAVLGRRKHRTPPPRMQALTHTHPCAHVAPVLSLSVVISGSASPTAVHRLHWSLNRHTTAGCHVPSNSLTTVKPAPLLCTLGPFPGRP